MRARSILALALGAALAAAGCGYVGPVTAGVILLAPDGGGNAPPTVNANTKAEITDLPRPVGAIQALRIRVSDAEGDPVSLVLEYKEQAGSALAAAEFRTAHLIRIERPDGTTVTAGALSETGPLATAPAPAGLEYILFWDWTQDLGAGAKPRITLRLSIAGVSELAGGVAFTSADRTIGNNPPVLTNVAVFGRSGTVAVQYRLSDSTADACRLDAFYRIDNGARVTMTAVAASELRNLTTTAAPAVGTFSWNTAAEPGIGRARVNVVVELVPIDDAGLAGGAAQGTTVAIVNDQPPTARVTGVPVRAADGVVRVDYELADPDADRAGIAPRFTIESGPTLAGGATSGAASSLGGDDGTADLAALSTGSAHVFRWNAVADLGLSAAGAPARRVSFEVVPTGAASVPGRSAAFLVGNDAPVATLAPLPATATGDVVVDFTLLDSTGDPAAVVAEYAVGAGGFAPATITGGALVALPTGDGATAVAYRRFWRSAADLPQASHAAVTLRLRGDDGLFGGAGAFDQRTVEITNAAGAPVTLAVSAISPAAGRTAGGTPVVILGSAFAAGATAKIGGADLGSLQVLSSGVITGTTPAGTTGSASVVVTVPGAGSATLANGFRYGDAPVIASVAPPDGPLAGGTALTITGSGFRPGETTARLGGVSLTALAVSSGAITGGAPGGAAGPVDLVVATPDGAAQAAGAFRYLAAPAITSIAPADGPAAGGTDVTILGSGFLASSVVVTLGGAPLASRAIVSDGEIRGRTPPGAGAAALEVRTPGGGVTVTAAFQYRPVPAIATVAPARGLATAPTSVTVTGSGFVAGATAVELGGVAATGVQVLGPTSLEATLPAGAPGAADIRVATTGGAATLPGGFTRVAAPRVDSSSPASGPAAGGTLVTLLGAGFLPGETAVTVGGLAAASVTVLSDGVLTARTPTSTAGAKAVAATTPFGTSAAGVQFTYREAPAIASVSPVDGPAGGGTRITIAGSGFDPAPGATTILVGGRVLVGPFTVSATAITGTTPVGAGPSEVAVTTPGGVAAASRAFTYLAVPTVGPASPAAGPKAGGTVVTLSGTGFLASAITVTAVGVGDLTGVSVASDTVLVGTMPPAPSAAAVAIRVSTPGGTTLGALADGFTYLAAPAITSLSATNGPATGGTSLTINGTGFLPGPTEVRIGGILVTPSSVSATAITLATPAHAAGSVAVVVTTPGGASPAATFTYEAAAATGLGLTRVTPAAGAPAGGTLVTLIGRGFSAGTPAVTFGGRAATDVAVASDSLLTARTPAAAAIGPVAVTVTVLAQSATLPLGFDYQPTVSFASSGTLLSAERRGEVQVRVVLQTDGRPLPAPVSVDVVDLGSGGATAGEDYDVVSPDTFIFPAGSTSGTVIYSEVTLVPDLAPEPTERARFRLENPQGAVLGPVTIHTITIPDDDTRVATFTATPARAPVGAATTLAWTIDGPPASTVPLALTPAGASDVTGLTSAQRTPFPLPVAPSDSDPAVPFKLVARNAFDRGEVLRLAAAAKIGEFGGGSYTQDFGVAADGSVVLVGNLRSNEAATFGSAPGTTTTVAAADARFFVARVAADGTPVYARICGGTSSMLVNAVRVLPDGSAIVAGQATFGSPVPPTFNLGGPGPVEVGFTFNTSAGFLVRYTPDGLVAWVRLIRDSTNNSAEVDAIDILPGGDIAATGVSSGSPILGLGEAFETTLATTPGTICFVGRFAPDGTLQRAWTHGGNRPTAIAALPDGGVAVAGKVTGTSIFAPGSPAAVTLTTLEASLYVACYAPSGSLRWVRHALPTNRGSPMLAAGRDGAVYAAVQFNGTLTWVDPAAADVTVTGTGTQKVGIVRFEADGDRAWVRASSGNASNYFAVEVLALPDGSVAVAGTVETNGTSETFGSGEPYEATVDVRGRADIYIARYGPDGTFLGLIGDGGPTDDYADPGAALGPNGTIVVVGSFGYYITEQGVFGRDDAVETLLPSTLNGIFRASYAPVNFAIREVRPAGIAWAAGARPGAASQGAETDRLAAFADGSVGAAGQLKQQATFGPGEPLERTLSATSSSAGWVGRYDPDGRLAFARAISTTSSIVVGDAAALPDGDLAVAGQLSGTTTFEGDPTPRTPAGVDPDIFLARYRADGSVRFVVTIGGTSSDFGASAAGFPDGSVAVTGAIATSVSATFGAAVGATQTPASGNGFFIARYAADGSLKTTVHVEARQLQATRVAAYASGGLVVAGAPAGQPPVLVRYDASDNVVWSATLTAQAGSVALQGVAAAPDGGAVAAGGFSGDTLQFLPGGATLAPTSGVENGFVARYDASGAVVWTVRVGGDPSGHARVESVALRPDGDVIVVGHFAGTALSLTAAGAEDVFFARLRAADGALVDAHRAGGTGSDFAYAIAARPDGSAILGGYFEDVAGGAGFGDATEPNRRTLSFGTGGSAAFVGKYFPYGD